jgi:hypothetical protein
MVLQCINGVGSNPVEGRTKNVTALKSNSNTVWFNFQYGQLVNYELTTCNPGYIINNSFIINNSTE